MRQFDPVVRGYAVTHPPGVVSLPTQPGWDQIIYAKSGLFVAQTAVDSWTIPPNRALCIASSTKVKVRTRKRTAMRCLYLRVELKAPTEPLRSIELSTLARELLLHAVAQSPFSAEAAANSSLLSLLFDQIAALPDSELHLPMPTDSRARSLTEILMSSPTIPLTRAIGQVGASRRTLERIFASETGLTLAAWQRRTRILAAIDLMSNNSSVAEAAMSVGYSTPSSFVTAFRSELGQTPSAFMKQERTD